MSMLVRGEVTFSWLVPFVGVLACATACSDDTGSSGSATLSFGSADASQGDESASEDADADADADTGDASTTDDDDTGTPPGVNVAPGGYYVQGNTIYDSNGMPVTFRGVARPSTEWNSRGESLAERDYILMQQWGVNVVRIPLNQNFWLPGSATYYDRYVNLIDDQIAWAKKYGMAVILDLHWSDRGNAAATDAEQQVMADTRSITLWESVAARYKDDGKVIFELYNEPHDISWPVWRDGGDSGHGFVAAGMQQLYDAVRSTGAHNLVVVGGLDWAFDLSQVRNQALTGYNIAYATHPYDYGNKQPSQFPYAFGNLAQQYPVIATEFGQFDCQTDYVQASLDYFAANNMSWVAWAWYPGGCMFPALIDSWDGTPSAAGTLIKNRLGG